ncbi:DUF2891 domain-containing protein [Sediminitomix flava]|uniref:DUF2891 family protein n=1 Tax=Sediminitomix flava TaxID=379075 RepID=A0A315ZCS3_SEDFL|nr:DUF2891 domain-containing protein [Sediminitomix flava]PWJ43385.1 Protein of unknown function (DUF2891) [Sediminitomix flava]
MRFLFFISFIFLVACTSTPQKQQEEEKTEVETLSSTLSIEQANRLSKLPLKCMDQEYPNKLSQTLASAEDLKSPKELHPAFYGCFDWHSSVHGHWMLVKLLKTFPELENAAEVREKLATNISKENIEKELAYFDHPYSKSYERTYGWAWLLKLAAELESWNDPLGKELSQNLQPLTDFIVGKYLDYLPKLNYPIRVGTHTNTAFGLTFAWDYAIQNNNTALKDIIEKKARVFFLNDTNAPLSWEPGGYDFLSPCMEEIDLMRRILPKEEFTLWLKNFLPQLSDKYFEWEPGKVSDRSDGHLVHLDGVNFSRAWCLSGISKTDPKYAHLKDLAQKHIDFSLPNIVDGDYMGEHWLASFALYALSEM